MEQEDAMSLLLRLIPLLLVSDSRIKCALGASSFLGFKDGARATYYLSLK